METPTSSSSSPVPEVMSLPPSSPTTQKSLPSSDEVPSSIPDIQPTDVTPSPETEHAARMRARRISQAQKRRARDMFILESFGSGNVDEVGCLKGIRIEEERSSDESFGHEIHSDDSQERFLTEIGAVMDTDIRQPLQLPTAEQLKFYESQRAKRPKIAKYKAPTDGMPSSYRLIWDVKGHTFQYRMVTKCASLALDDYNLIEDTKYRLVDLEKVGWRMGCDMHYCIIFKAKTSEGTENTFEAEVKHSKLGKKRAGATSVVGVRMKDSKWHAGVLKEIVSWN